MWPLIKREFEALYAPLLLIALITGGYIIWLFFWLPTYLIPRAPCLGLPFVYSHLKLFMILPVFSAAVGALQMTTDRSSGISTFLSTLATSRNRIFAARLIAGIASFVFVLAALAIADAVLINRYCSLVPMDIAFLIRMFATAFLISLAGYGIGLLAGWRANKVLPVLIVILLLIPLFLIVFFTGLGWQSYLLLLAIALAGLILVWQKYRNVSL